MLKMKMTSIERQPQNIKSGISQQPLIGSSSNFKLKLRGPDNNKKLLEIKMSSIGRQTSNIEWKIFQYKTTSKYENGKCQ